MLKTAENLKKIRRNGSPLKAISSLFKGDPYEIFYNKVLKYADYKEEKSIWESKKLLAKIYDKEIPQKP